MTPILLPALAGFAGARLRLNISQYLSTFDIHRYIGMVEQKQYRGAAPLGEHAGKWLEAAILACEWSGDALLRQRTTGMLERLLAAQEPDGYLGITHFAARFRPQDPYELACTLRALRTAAALWNNGPALNAAERLEAFLSANFAGLKADAATNADQTEHNLWNRLFAAQTIDGDAFRCQPPQNGWKPDGYNSTSDSCSSSAALALAKVPTLFYSASDTALHINQYGPSTLRIDLAGTPNTIRQQTDYPSAETVAIEIDPARPARFTIHLRLPVWCPNPTLRLNGKPAGRVINRLWTKGDRIDLDFPMPPRWTRGPQGIALNRGPLLYVLDGRWNDPSLVTSVKSVRRATRQVPVPSPATLGAAFEVSAILNDGRQQNALLTPFANLGDWYRSTAEKTAWIEHISGNPAPTATDPAGRILPYSVWLPSA